jgi:hypothetical protein
MEGTADMPYQLRWHLSRIAYWLYCYGPWFVMRGRIGFAILPWAGHYAHSETYEDFIKHHQPQ